MAFYLNSEPQPPGELSASLQQACDDYRHFVLHILRPAKNELETNVRQNKVTLHQVYGANLIAAHSVDYLLAVRTAAGIPGRRTELVATFDRRFAISGAYIRNRKMELIDAINNGLKHIRLLPARYKELGERYGQISFRSLDELNGRIMCHLVEYRFDYCRVVLLPAFAALSNWELHSARDVLDFARGDFEIICEDHALDLYDPNDPSTAIDQMIEICSSPCINCEEAPDDCQCGEYVFAGEQGRYEPLYAASSSQLQELMEQISPSYGN